MKQTYIIRILFSSLILLLFVIFVQCYTTFKHPEIFSHSDSTEVYHSKEINFLEDCSSCHVQDDPVNDSHLQVYDNPLYQDNYNWQYYYVMPWWIDDYYYQDHLASQKDVLPAPQRRDFDRREMPASSATPATVTSGATLSKPANSEPSPAPSSSESQPQKRNERREVVPREKSDSKQSTTTAPDRKKREDQKTKKENE